MALGRLSDGHPASAVPSVMPSAVLVDMLAGVLRCRYAGPRFLVPGPEPRSVRVALHARLEDALGAACDGDEVHLGPGEHSAASLSRLRESISLHGAGRDA